MEARPIADGNRPNCASTWRPFFILIQRLRAKYRKVTWFAENVVCPEFVDAMKALFPEANCALVNHASFSAERRKRAYFATPEFDLTALSRLTGGCTVADFFDIDQGRGPYVRSSISAASKTTHSQLATRTRTRSRCRTEKSVSYEWWPFEAPS